MEKSLLMIIDPQIDFISGTLPVPGAISAMNSLAEYIHKKGQNYSVILITADRHPIRHCSFEQYGGKWPRHCVADSCGAAIWQPILDALYDYNGKIIFLYKGQDEDIEEYSIFKNKSARATILNIIKNEAISKIDICGLTGDICVASTVVDGIDLLGKEKFRILSQFSPSIDGGTTLGHLMDNLLRL